MTFLTKAVALSLICASLVWAQSVTTPLRTAAEVRHLSPAQAAQQRPVSIRAVVTWVNLPSGELFVQDGSAGIFIFIRDSTSDAPLHPGQLVDVAGVTAPGDFSSSITKARLTVVGEAPMPEPVRFPFDRILTGEQDSQWGHLDGVVRSGREENGLLFLNTFTSGGVFLAIVKDYPSNWSASWVDSKISLNGVLAALFNDRRQVTGVRIFVPSRNFIQVDERAPASPFDLPETSAGNVGAFRIKQDWSHRIRVRASVTAVVSRSLVYLSDGENSLPAELWLPCAARPGSFVDMVGFPGTVDGRPGLQNAVCRTVDGGKPVRPVELSADEIVPPPTAGDGSGLAIAKGTRNDLKLITVEGSVIQVVKGAVSQALTLMSEDQTFSVTIPESVGWFADAIVPGTQLKVTGVCLIAFDEYHRAQSFRLLARQSNDIVVVSRPARLTLRRALWIIFPLLLVLFGGTGWIWVLRRHVATSTSELRSANQRLSQLAVEDALTGAANRRRFDEKIREEAADSRKIGMPLSLVMIDLDHFKQVNDLYGHQRGDQYLIQVVGALRRALVHTPDTLVARYGGEEFAVLLPRIGQDTAALLAEQMRASVHEMAIFHERSPFDRRQTVSLGVATFNPFIEEADPDCLIGRADRALYRAKQSGRNCVVIFDPALLSERGITSALDGLFRATSPLVSQPPPGPGTHADSPT